MRAPVAPRAKVVRELRSYLEACAVDDELQAQGVPAASKAKWLLDRLHLVTEPRRRLNKNPEKPKRYGRRG